MDYIKTEILTAAQKQEVQVHELPINITNDMREQLRRKFTNGQPYNFLWECLTDEAAIVNPESWKWIKDFVGNDESILIYDEANEDKGFVFENGAQIVPILDECYYAYRDFYLTDNDTHYVICFNHHNVLIACGTAREWLRKEILNQNLNQ